MSGLFFQSFFKHTVDNQLKSDYQFVYLSDGDHVPIFTLIIGKRLGQELKRNKENK